MDETNEQEGSVTRRDFLTKTSAVAATASVGVMIDHQDASAAVLDEYGYAGMYTAGYADPMTVNNGSTLRIWVQTGKSYSFRIARLSLDGQRLREPAMFEGPVSTVVSSDPRRGLWNSYASFTIGANWQDGLWAVDIGPDNNLRPLTTNVASALFVLRRGIAASKILYKLPTNTWNAYNRMPWLTYDTLGGGGTHTAGERSFYEDRAEQPSGMPYYRPGIGINGDQIAGWVLSPVAGANCFFEGHDVFLPWLKTNFTTFDFCTDLDLHSADAKQMLSKYRLLICSGHDEYWSQQMRVNVAAHVNSGRNVAFLGGNNLYWKVNISAIQSTSPTCTMYWVDVNKTPSNRATGGWPANEAKLTGMSGRGGGGWVPQNPVRLQFDSSVVSSWMRHGLGTMQLASNADWLIGYEFDNVHSSTPPDYVSAATTGPYITAQSGSNFDVTTGGLSATLCYFQPYGGIVNAGTTEWIKYASLDPSGVGQATKNIVRTLSSDRRFISVGPFSRSTGFDIVYSNQIELPGETNNSCIVSFWALDSSKTSPAIERGKWLSMRQTVSNYTAKAFGRNAAGAPRIFYQDGSGQVTVWDVSMTSTDATTLRPLVSSGAFCFTTTWRLIGAGQVSGSAQLDLIFASSTQILVQTMGGSIGHLSSNAVTMNMPATGAKVAAFGSVPFNGVHVPAVAFTIGTRLVIARVTMLGLVVVIDTTISGLTSATQLGGFADLNGDGYPEFVVSQDNFSAGVSAAVRSGIRIDVSLGALVPLAMKTGYLHDA